MKLIKLFVAIALCVGLSVTVFAHSGGTDSKGGHYDHSTGEYHYHHGYPEHQHFDMTGDGIPDCPYLIDKSEIAKATTPETTEVYKSPNEEEEKLENPTLFFCLFALVIVLAVISFKKVFDMIKDK